MGRPGRMGMIRPDRLLRFLNALRHDVRITVSEDRREGVGRSALEVVTA